MKYLKLSSVYIQVILIFFVTMSLFIFLNIYQNNEQRDTLKINVKYYKDAITREIHLAIHALDAIKSLYVVKDTVSAKEFRIFTQDLIEDHSAIQALEWVPKILDKELSVYETNARKRDKDFMFKEKSADKLVGVSKREVYYPVYYVEPYIGNELALGFDLASSPSIMKTLLQAQKEKTTFATSKVPLVQTKDKEDGFLVFLSLKNDVRNLDGFILGVFKIKELISIALQNYNLLDTQIQIDDITDGKTSLYYGGIDEDFFVHSELLHFSGRIWQVSGGIKNQYLSMKHFFANSVLLFGLLLIVFVLYRSAKLRENEIDLLELNKTLEDKYRLILKELEDHKHAVDEHSIVVKTDLSGTTTYVNTKYIQTSGYLKEELIGHNQSVVKSGVHEDSFWQEMYEILDGEKTWHGEICNRSKNGSLFWLETTIVPFLDEEGASKSFIAISTDISNIKESERSIRKKDRLLLEQSRLAQMGELISMIAHQWRQPLGAIAATNIDLRMKILLDIYDLDKENDREVCKNYLIEGLDKIEQLTINLTTTIDDFKDFYKPNRVRNKVGIHQVIEKTKLIIGASYKVDNIRIEEEYLSHNAIDMLDGEVMQVLLNIFKNAQDNFISKNSANRCVKITSNDVDNGILIRISDNGGGIDNAIIDKIFDPYFSTKSEKNGTGLGLYMSKVIVQDHHWGSLDAQNIENGVMFTIVLKGEKS